MKIRLLPLVLALCISAPCLADDTDSALQTVTRTVKFDTSEIIRSEIPLEMYGYSHEFARFHGMAGGESVRSRGTNFLATDYNEANPAAVVAIQGYPMNHFRIGGTSANYANWKYLLGEKWHYRFTNSNKNVYAGYSDGIGSADMRIDNSSTILKRMTNSYKVSAQDIIKILNGYNKDASYTWCLNVNTDTLENQIDLVEFLTSDGSVNYNGGENWGKIRRETYGIDKINMYAWELGNEVDLNKTNIDEYIEAIKKFVPAIRTVDKTTPIAVTIASNDTGSVGVDWQRKLLIECGDIIDYIIIHKYFGVNHVAAVCESTLRKTISDIEKYGDPERHKIIFTEYNTSFAGSDTETWKRNTSISAAVTIGDYLIRMLNYPQLVETDFQALNGGGGTRTANPKTGMSEEGYYTDGGPWWAYYVDTDKTVKAVAPIEVMKLFNDNSSDAKVIGYNYQDFTLGKAATSSAIPLLQKNGDVCLFVTNFDKEKELEVTIENDGYYLKEDTVIYGTNGEYSMNFRDKKEVEIVTKNHKGNNECKTYSMPAMSFAMLRLSPGAKVSQNGGYDENK